MEIVLCGRNVEVPQHFREHVGEKLARVERYDHKIIRIDVELAHEPNPRRAKSCQSIQITGRGRGPVVRGEGCAADFYSALDMALSRLESRLRRAHDRRRVHRGRRAPLSVAQATGIDGQAVDARSRTNGASTAVLEGASPDAELSGDLRVGEPTTAGLPGPRAASDDGLPGQIVRRKEHHAVPMSVDDALSQMELVGHDFFLFSDVETGRPSVVYRRHAYDYGVIALR